MKRMIGVLGTLAVGFALGWWLKPPLPSRLFTSWGGHYGVREPCTPERERAVLFTVSHTPSGRNLCSSYCKTWEAREDGICYAADEPR